MGKILRLLSAALFAVPAFAQLNLPTNRVVAVGPDRGLTALSLSLQQANGLAATVQTNGDLSLRASGGSVARKLADRFAVVRDMADVGAVGDDSTDNTAVFQAALDEGKEIYVPAGIYRTKALRFPAGGNVHIRGAGRETTILTFIDPTTSATLALGLADESTPARNILVENIGFKLPSTGAGTITTLLRLKNASYSKFSFCRFDLAGTNLTTRTAIVLDGNNGAAATYYNEFSNCEILNAYSGVSVTGQANVNAFTHCKWLEGVYGVTINGTVNTTISFSSFQNFGGSQIVRITGSSSYNNAVLANWFEGMDCGVYFASGTKANTLIGNQYSGCTGRTYLNESGFPQTIMESSLNSFYDTAWLSQFLRLFEYSLPTFPVTSTNYNNAVWAQPATSTNASALVTQLVWEDGTPEMVPFAMRQNFTQIPTGTTMPDIRYKTFLRTFNTNATTITNFSGAYPGQRFWLWVLDNNTTFDFGATNTLRGANVNAPYKARDGDKLFCISDDAGHWLCTIFPATYGFTVTASGGLQVRPVTGSVWDWALLKADGSSAAAVMPTGTRYIDFQDGISVSGNSNQKIFSGSGDPSTNANSAISAASNGSIYLRQDSGGGFYTRTNNFWVPK
jgi:hypothetical protein